MIDCLQFIQVIYYQLKFGLQESPANTIGTERGASIFMDDSWLSKESFFYLLCKEFFLLVQEASVVDGSLLSWTRRLQELLETTLGWELHKNNTVDGFYEDDDEFAPVVEILDDTSFQESP
ncbi:hypothetical protein GIB67_025642 [Kingdonia uniflora]|uniref:AAR2 C-terminal domain-containing protein n=1 Tax=Kingdonia uniflora TaxID=39325 RepID=A0A7J7L8J1_9MAGN|nr:hypothetical protein GIB67_025642 [Kingdonia uniflora]